MESRQNEGRPPGPDRNSSLKSRPEPQTDLWLRIQGFSHPTTVRKNCGDFGRSCQPLSRSIIFRVASRLARAKLPHFIGSRSGTEELSMNNRDGLLRNAAYFGLGMVSTIASTISDRTQNKRQWTQGKVVVITGGSRGLGLALAEEFGRR